LDRSHFDSTTISVKHRLIVVDPAMALPSEGIIHSGSSTCAAFSRAFFGHYTDITAVSGVMWNDDSVRVDKASQSCFAASIFRSTFMRRCISRSRTECKFRADESGQRIAFVEVIHALLQILPRAANDYSKIESGGYWRPCPMEMDESNEEETVRRTTIESAHWWSPRMRYWC
jgi:hypothetical protein